MSNEEYQVFLDTINELPEREREIIKKGVLQLNEDKKVLWSFIKELMSENTFTKQSTQMKTSKELIELVKPMDLMYIDISPDDCGGIVVPRVAETLNELKKWKQRFATGECILKGVLTKEQIQNVIYWVSEDV